MTLHFLNDLQLVNQNGVIVVRYFILSVTSHINWSDARCLIKVVCCLSHGICLYQVMMTLHSFDEVANEAKSI